jgi:quinol monooxygenase YgiN
LHCYLYMKAIDGSCEIVSAIRTTVRPENRTELCLTIASLLEPIRHEKGCRAYRFYREDGDQYSFILIGEWETRDAWDRHLNSDSFSILLGSLTLLSNRSDVEFKLLSHVSAIEAVTKARCEPSVDADFPIRFTTGEILPHGRTP